MIERPDLAGSPKIILFDGIYPGGLPLDMTIASFSDFIRDNYEIHEWRHASAILENDFPGEWADLIAVLKAFRLKKDHLIVGGGRKSLVSASIDEALYQRGWEERHFETKIVVDENERDSPTHSIDCFKNAIALEIEWNNKDPF